MPENSGCRRLGLESLGNQDHIAAAEGEGISHDRVEMDSCPAVHGHIVQIVFRAGYIQVDGRCMALCCNVINAAMNSTVPAAPIRCPRMDLVELSGTLAA